MKRRNPVSKRSLTIAALAVMFVATSAMSADEVFTPDHVAKLRSVAAVKMSPDGTQIAYLLSVPRRPYEEENGSPWSELHVVDAKNQARPFITGPVSIGSIDWTPDGRGISFLTKRGKDKHRSLYVIPIDGGEARKVLSHKTGVGGYSWSPDGKRVAFLSTPDAPKARKKLEDKGFSAEGYEEDLRSVQVWIGTADDEDAESRVIELDGSASELHWSPAGDKLVVALAPSPLIDDQYMKRRIHVIDVESGKSLAQVDREGKLGSVHWSPGGTHLAMIAAEDINDPSAGRLYVVPATGGKPRDLIPGYEGEITSIAWQDDETIMFLGDEGVWTTLGEIGIDGANRKTHIPSGQMVAAGLSLSRNGQTAAMVSQSDKHPAEVFLMSHGDNGPRRLTDSNPWLADVRLAQQEVVTYHARDGVMIEGLLIKPLDYEAGRHYPLILTVHGGPESHYRNGWITRYSDAGQVGAAEGFAVFYPNYRGSTGRGVAFSKMSQADYGGKEFDDLIDGVDHLINLGLVDRDRVGITGGSYGGFATAWCSTYHTERFAAGVMFVGISDQISKSSTTDIPNEMFYVHARKRLWDDWQFFLERSPIYYAEKARTPLLIMHGKNDTRVHPSQSMELFRTLKVIGKTPVRLVWYPGEGHGNRKAGARYDYNLRMMRWFKHYLVSPGGDPPPFDLDYGFGDGDGDDGAKGED